VTKLDLGHVLHRIAPKEKKENKEKMESHNNLRFYTFISTRIARFDGVVKWYEGTLLILQRINSVLANLDLHSRPPGNFGMEIGYRDAIDFNGAPLNEPFCFATALYGITELEKLHNPQWIFGASGQGYLKTLRIIFLLKKCFKLLLRSLRGLG
jgi:hypothetical protein